MGLHAEIMAARDRHGITYKDASHRLYMTESEKVRTDDRMKKAFSVLAEHSQDSLLHIRKKFQEINENLGVQDAEAGEPQ